MPAYKLLARLRNLTLIGQDRKTGAFLWGWGNITSKELLEEEENIMKRSTVKEIWK